MNLKEAKVLITGGSSGIGEATARLLKQQGAQIVIAGRNIDTLMEIADELDVIPFVADVAQEEDVANMVRFAIEKMGDLNVLINNAGFGYVAPLLEIDVNDFKKVYETNVLGAMLCARECARHFVKKEYGNILNIGSTSALKGSAGGSPYVATKHALKGMTESWREELRKHNIRVTLINPSEVMTNFASNRITGKERSKKIYTEGERQTKLRSEEVAHTISSVLQMEDRGFVTEVTIFATNPKT